MNKLTKTQEKNKFMEIMFQIKDVELFVMTGKLNTRFFIRKFFIRK